MSDTTIQGTIEAPSEAYSPVVAAKDSLWGVGKLGAAITLVPQVTAFLAQVGVILTPSGTASKALPYIIFIVLHLLHDAAALKSQSKWM